MADPADDLAFGAIGQKRERLVPRIALHAGNPNLDQFVRLERARRFRDHGVADAGLADEDDRLQPMRKTAEMAALFVRQFHDAILLRSRRPGPRRPACPRYRRLRRISSARGYKSQGFAICFCEVIVI